MIPTWRTYPEGVPADRSLLWLGGQVVGLVCPGWSTYYVTYPGGQSMDRGPTVETEDEAREVVVLRLVAGGVLTVAQAESLSNKGST